MSVSNRSVLTRAAKSTNSEKVKSATPNTSYVSITHGEEGTEKKTANNIVQDLRNRLAGANARNDDLTETVTSLRCKVKEMEDLLKVRDDNITLLQDHLQRLCKGTNVADGYTQTVGHESSFLTADAAVQTCPEMDFPLNTQAMTADDSSEVIKRVALDVFRSEITPLLLQIKEMKSMMDSVCRPIKTRDVGKSVELVEHRPLQKVDNQNTMVSAVSSDPMAGNRDSGVGMLTKHWTNSTSNGCGPAESKQGSGARHTQREGEGSAGDGHITVSPNDETWTKVRQGSRKRKGTAIVGELQMSGIGLKVAPKVVHLHVTRLHPETTCDDIIRYLGKEFPEVGCEMLKSRFPDHYASFKVTINSDNKERGLDPKLWPEGTLVRMFFQRRNVNAAVS